jgi:PAS domain S-box-containing protein
LLSASKSSELALLQRAIKRARNGVIITDCRLPDDPIVFANDAFYELTGYSEAEMIGHNCRFLQGSDTDPAALASLRVALRAGHNINNTCLRASRSPDVRT